MGNRASNAHGPVFRARFSGGLPKETDYQVHAGFFATRVHALSYPTTDENDVNRSPAMSQQQIWRRGQDTAWAILPDSSGGNPGLNIQRNNQRT